MRLLRKKATGAAEEVVKEGEKKLQQATSFLKLRVFWIQGPAVRKEVIYSFFHFQYLFLYLKKKGRGGRGASK